jgi:hypothetical protein
MSIRVRKAFHFAIFGITVLLGAVQASAAERGLLAEYFSDKILKASVHTRVDARVDFKWTAAPPIPEIKGGEFSVRCHGWVKPELSGTHTFYVTGGEGCRAGWLPTVLNFARKRVISSGPRRNLSRCR